MKTKEVQEHDTDTAGDEENVLNVGTVNRNSTPITFRRFNILARPANVKVEERSANGSADKSVARIETVPETILSLWERS